MKLEYKKYFRSNLHFFSLSEHESQKKLIIVVFYPHIHNLKSSLNNNQIHFNAQIVEINYICDISKQFLLSFKVIQAYEFFETLRWVHLYYDVQRILTLLNHLVIFCENITHFSQIF